jgi:hypothetical protein
MANSDLLPSPLFELNENQLALEAAILEHSNWAEQRGPEADVGMANAVYPSTGI